MLTRSLAVAATFALAALGSPLLATAPAVSPALSEAEGPALSEVEAPSDQAVAHALNRLTFGPRPDDLERVKSEGLEKWIERQLNPSGIDDQGMFERLSHLSTLGLDSQTIARDIHQPARRERQRLRRENSAAETRPVNSDPSMSAARANRADGLPPRSGNSRPPLNQTMRRDQQIITDLAEAKILRAVYSNRQLEEVLVDLWFNHFNVFAAKGPTRVWLGEFEREAIRPHVLGNFRTMLEAVAKSPAMLFYLDNWMNVRLRSEDSSRASARQVPLRGPLARRATGLNENYARELMELHTLGVDGGYMQQDVVNVARAFTGWTLRLAGSTPRTRPARSGLAPEGAGFYFDADLHDDGEKTVLGHSIKAGGGIDDGQQVLDILAAHPATAHLIAEKLARRFVSDEPPADLVNRAAARFSATQGDLRETTRVIITSPEFSAPAAYRAKVKTPLEFVVSALRATGTDVRIALPVVRGLRELGMPLYLCQPPTGYDDTAAAWISSGALVSRLNLALALGGNRWRGVQLPFEPTTPVPSVRATLLTDALSGSASPATVATIEKATTVEQTVALTLGSPEFQRK